MINSVYGYNNMAYSGFTPVVSDSSANSVSTGNDKEDMSDARIKALKRAGVIECTTCANRQYQDGSDESDVSFKAPGHISPQASASTVMAHEQQHVSNAHQKAGSKNGEVMQASVTLHTAICPECGRSYVSGGETTTSIRYDKSTPYGNNMKKMHEANGAVGGNINIGL